MKKIFIGIALVIGFVALSSTSVDAHIGDYDDMPMMSGEVSSEEFDDIQDVMIKMMNGEELSETESDQMIEFMQSHNEEWWPMMGYGMMNISRAGWGGGMMWNDGVLSTMGWMVTVTTFVWLLVGLLLIIFLLKKISSK